MRKHPVSGVIFAFALCISAWVYLFHDYVSGDRWAWAKHKMGTHASTTVILGKEGEANPVDKIARLKERLKKRNELARSLGIRFLYVVPTNSGTVYAECRSTDPTKGDVISRTNRTMKELRGNGVDMLYLAKAQKKGKALGLLYDVCGSHGNRLGSFVNGQAVATHLSQYYPAMKVTLGRLAQFEIVSGLPGSETQPLNAAEMQRVKITGRAEPEPVPKAGWSTRMETIKFGRYQADLFTKDDKSLPTVLMFGDSFMPGMRRPIAENFRRAVFLNPWTTAEPQLSDDVADFLPEVIEAEKPDIVIYERWEDQMLNSYSEWVNNTLRSRTR